MGQTATKSDGTFEEAVRAQKQREADLLIRKHRDYGPLNISRAPGGALNGINVRQWDKLARAQNLVESGDDPENESLRDTYVDQANYGSIAVLVLDGVWPSGEGQAGAQRPANHVDDGRLKIEANLRQEIRELAETLVGVKASRAVWRERAEKTRTAVKEGANRAGDLRQEISELRTAIDTFKASRAAWKVRAEAAEKTTLQWRERAKKAEEATKQWASRASECVGRAVNAERDARDARMQAERQRPSNVAAFPRAVSADPHGEWKEQQERKAAMERHPSNGQTIALSDVVKEAGDDEW